MIPTNELDVIAIHDVIPLECRCVHVLLTVIMIHQYWYIVNTNYGIFDIQKLELKLCNMYTIIGIIAMLDKIQVLVYNRYK